MSRSSATQAPNRAIELIRTSDRVFLATHVRPDGDALGSLLGLALGLERIGLTVARLCADPLPAAYAFLPTADLVTQQPPTWRADLGVVVDCDGLARVGPLAPAFSDLPRLIDIDHHATSQTFGDVRITEPEAAACAEIVFDLLHALGVALDPDIATCLYTGVLTDTGRFCFGNTTARSLTVAAALVRAGAQPSLVARKVYEDRSIGATHLLGVALSRLSADFDARVVSAVLTRDDFGATGAVSADTEGIIDHLRAIGGPRVATLFVQMENGEVRVSLRSDGSVDVSAVALAFGGGGHAMAAGCTCPGSVEEVRGKVLAAVRERLPTVAPADVR